MLQSKYQAVPNKVAAADQEVEQSASDRRFHSWLVMCPGARH